MSNTPYMNLNLPVPTQTVGPAWATELNQTLTQVDSHNHTSGQGTQIPTAGLNINADLPINGYNLNSLRSLRLAVQSATLTLPADVSSLYVVGGNLYYNNSIGQAIQITAGAALNATSIGGIGGDYATSTASEFYTSAKQTFTFTQSTNVAANIDVGSVIIRPNTTSANGVTVSAPTGLAASYGLTLPTALPVSTKIATVDNTGQIATALDVDNSTTQIVSNVLSVKPGGITNTQLAPTSIAASNLQTSAIAGIKLQTITSNSSFTPATNVNAVYVDMWSGGGGGGGSNTSVGGGGGASGVRWQGWVPVTPGTPVTVTVGVGGTGGVSGNNGSDGGSTSFGSITVPGGTGGKSAGNGGGGGSYTALGALCAAGGQATTGPGGSSTAGTSTFYGTGGNGGVNFGGGGAAGWLAGANGGATSTFGGGNGSVTNSGSGGGGGGLSGAEPGGNGQAGLVTVYWAGLP